MHNERKIKISVGKSRTATTWATQDINWSDFIDRLKTPVKHTETLAVYKALTKSQQDELKDVGGFVGGTLRDNKRKKANVLTRDLIALDADNIKPGEKDNVLRAVAGLGCAYAVYSTRKHEDYAPRLRVIIPLDEPCTADEYEPISRRMAEYIGMPYFDPTTFDCARLMYWPSVSCDSEYVLTFEDKPFLSRQGILGSYANWQDCSTWAASAGHEVTVQRLIKKQGDPLSKDGAIGAFCRKYSITDAINTFLSEFYTPCEITSGRFTFVGGSTVGGAVNYDDKFLYSHHATDPCSLKLCNVFDLVRIHLFGEEDEHAKEGTSNNNLPSYAKMMSFAMSDEDIENEVKKARTEKMLKDFEGITPTNYPPQTEGAETDNLDWVRKLKCNPKTGDVLKTIDNAMVIMLNDPNIKGVFAHDEFANVPMMLRSAPWRDIEDPERWSEVDDSGLRSYLEKVYGFTGREKLNDAFLMAIHKNAFDDVRTYLEKLQPWDGVHRVDKMLVDYLGTEDIKYYHQIARKTLVAAIKRVFEPGCKFDNIMVLSGAQGLGKSTFISKLGQKWFSDNIHDFSGKEASGQLQGYWILEVSELAGLSKTDVETAKGFIARSTDIYRAPYERRTMEFPRRCILIGSTNSQSFLRDKSGGRRFWPVTIREDKATKSIFTDLEKDVDQIWAEALLYYRLGEKVHITDPDVKAYEKYIQSAYSEDCSKEGIIKEFISRKIPADWSTKSIAVRRIFWNNEFAEENEESGVLVQRKKICVQEIWCEALGGELKDCKRADSIEITQILENLEGWNKDKAPSYENKDYGTQRHFSLVDSEERAD